MSTCTTPHPTASTISGDDGSTVADDTLYRLLDDDLDFETRTRSGLSSHLSMELYALHRLGASAAPLQQAFDGYAATGAVERVDRAALDRAREQVWSDGIAATISTRVSPLVVAAGAQWFHAVIRLAYAAEADHTGQVANALMSWEAAVGQVNKAPAHHMAGIASDDSSMGDLARVSLEVYAGTDGLATLHMVTGTHAARVVGSYLDDDTRVILHDRMADALTANHISIGSPLPPTDAELRRRRNTELPPWSRIDAAAVQISDAHVAKLVYTCASECLATGDPLYQWCAARAAGLAPAGSATR